MYKSVTGLQDIWLEGSVHHACDLLSASSTSLLNNAKLEFHNSMITSCPGVFPSTHYENITHLKWKFIQSPCVLKKSLKTRRKWKPEVKCVSGNGILKQGSRKWGRLIQVFPLIAPLVSPSLMLQYWQPHRNGNLLPPRPAQVVKSALEDKYTKPQGSHTHTHMQHLLRANKMSGGANV